MNSGDHTTPAELVRQAIQLAKNGDIDESCVKFSNVIHNDALAPGEVDQVRWLFSNRKLSDRDAQCLSVLLLGQCTTGSLTTSLRVIDRGDYVDFDVSQPGCDSVFQSRCRARNCFWANQPSSDVGAVGLAKHLPVAVRAVTSGPKIEPGMDLDNTYRLGMIGEAGPLGIAFGGTPDSEAFPAFQREANSLLKNVDRHLARCLIPVDFSCWSEPVPVFPQNVYEGWQRTSWYQPENQRRSLRAELSSIHDGLPSLNPQAVCELVRGENIQRRVQPLETLEKTNQFDLTTRRLDESDLRLMKKIPGYIAIVIQSNRFGGQGFVSVSITTLDRRYGDTALRIDTGLMSFRVIGRTLVDFKFIHFNELARTNGYESVIGEFIPDRKNQLVGDFYERFGFKRFPEAQEGRVQYHFVLNSARKLCCYPLRSVA